MDEIGNSLGYMIKNQKILLAKSYNRMSYGITPPISLGYLAASLAQEGWNNIEILDCVLQKMPPDKFKERIARIKPDILGMTLFSNNLPMVRRHLQAAKEACPDIITIVGGPHPSAVAEEELFQYFGESLDYAFKGEGDKGLPMLLNKIFERQEADFENIPGLVWKDGGILKSNAPFLEKDLDSLPMPRWDLMPPGSYPQAPSGSFFKQFPIAFLVTSRGCPYQCSFCASKPVVGRNIRFRSVQNVMDEILYVSQVFGVKEFHILDDNFTLNRERAYAICQSIIDAKINVTFFVVNGVRLDTLDEGLLSVMKKAGFYAINVGIESGSQRILDHMHKNLNKNLIREKIDLISRMGFRVSGPFIVGYPAETKEDIEESIEFAKSLNLDRTTFSFFLPLPGSEMYDFLKARGELDKINWDKVSFDSISYVPKSMTEKELRQLQRKGFLSFYLRPKIIWKLLKDLRSYEHFKYLFKRAVDYFVPTQ